MLNNKAKTLLNKMQYITDRFVKVNMYTQPKKIIGEPHTVEALTDGSHIAFFGELVSDATNHIVTVTKEAKANGGIPDFTSYILATQMPQRANECYVDRENNIIYFHSSQINCKISISYYSVGVGMISSALIYTRFDSNGKITETLSDLTRKCQTELDRVSTINDAEQLKTELRSYIIALTKLKNRNIDTGESVASSTKTQNILIAKSSWVKNSDGRYSFLYHHYLDTDNLLIEPNELVEYVKTSALIDYEKIDRNTLTFYSHEPIDLGVTITATYATANSSQSLMVNDEKVEKLESKVEELTAQVNYLKKVIEDLVGEI